MGAFFELQPSTLVVWPL